MLKSLLSNKEKPIKLANTPLNENFSAVILKKLLEKLVPLILGRPFLRIAYALIDVHGEEMILRDGNERLTLNMRHGTSSYSTQPPQESINMIDVYNVSHEEILEDLFATNHPSGNPTSSLTSHTDLTSPEVNDDIFDPEGDIIENLLNLDKTKDLPPYHDNPLSGNPTPISEPVTNDSFPPGNSNPLSPLPPFHNSLSGSTTSSSPSLPISETSDYSLEEFADELAHITFPPGNDDLSFNAKSDLREIEYFLNHDPIKEMDSILEDSVDKNSPDDNLVDTISKMFTDEHTLDYSSPPLWDDYDDELFDLETANDNTYDDPFDSKEEKIIESKLLIDELDLPGSSDFLPSLECDLVFYVDFFEVDACLLPTTRTRILILLFMNFLSKKKFPGLKLYSRFHSKMRKKCSTPGFSLLKEFILLFSRNYLIETLKLSKSSKFLKARWRFFLALIKRTSESWMFRVSISIPLDKLKYEGIGSS
ncbi:hypothetical protein Tco_0199953 [Tanacetum coccineum]